MRINQNIAAFNAYRNLNQTQTRLSSSLEKLSSGFRINRAADDASGLVNSENLRAQIGGLKVASRNAQDAISMVQTAEGAMTEVHSALQRMRDLVVEAGNLAPNDTTSLRASQDEINQLVDELDRISEQTQFGTKKILDGTFGGAGFEPLTVFGGVGDSAAFLSNTPGNASTPSTLTINVVDSGTPADGLWAAVDAEELGTPAVAEFGADGAYEDYDGKFELSFTVDGETIAVEVDRGASASEIGAALQAFLDEDAASDTPTLTGTYSVSVDVTNGNVELARAGSGDAWSTSVTASGTEGAAVFQVGANADQRVEVAIGSVAADQLGGGADITTAGWTDVASLRDGLTNLSETNLPTGIDDALLILDKAIEDVSAQRAELGAFQNRMESTIRNLSVAVENLSAAESRIRDTDMALEMVEFTRNQILSQAGTAMLAQANVVPQSVLSLLG